MTECNSVNQVLLEQGDRIACIPDGEYLNLEAGNFMGLYLHAATERPRQHRSNAS